MAVMSNLEQYEGHAFGEYVVILCSNEIYHFSVGRCLGGSDKNFVLVTLKILWLLDIFLLLFFRS